MQRDIGDLDLDRLGRGPVDGAASTEALVDALGTSFATFTLYEDPRGNEAFTRALATLARAPFYPWRAGAGIDGFSVDGETVAIRREGSIRFARGLFAMGVAAIELVSPPTADDLIRVLQLTALEHPDHHPDAILRDAGVATIRLLDRAMLMATGDGDPGPDAPKTTTRAIDDDSPAGFVLGMLHDGADPATVARRFVEEYERSHLLVDVDDAWGIEELVHAFVDGFWYLPEPHRAAIFSLMLERSDRPENTAFLDQFGGMELAQMNRAFGSGGHPLLAEYLRVAAREGGRPGDDMSALLAAIDDRSLTARIVGQVASVLGSRDDSGASRSETAVGRLASHHPGDDERRRSTTNLLRGLLALSAGTGRLQTVLATWAGRVGAALAEGDLRAADEWLGAIAGVDVGDTPREEVAGALAGAMQGPAVDALARLLTAPPPDGPGSVVRRAAPQFAGPGLVAELADEHHAGRRKALLSALQVIAHLRPQDLLPHLADDRWYVVRNVVVALGASRRAEVAGRVARLAGHPDHRVRIEVLRAIYRLRGEGAADELCRHLGDPDEAVAAEAARLVAAIPDPGLDRRLIRLTGEADLPEALAAIAALGRRDSPAAAEALRRLARRPLAVGRRRSLRKAARRAMEARR